MIKCQRHFLNMNLRFVLLLLFLLFQFNNDAATVAITRSINNIQCNTLPVQCERECVFVCVFSVLWDCIQFSSKQWTFYRQTVEANSVFAVFVFIIQSSQINSGLVQFLSVIPIHVWFLRLLFHSFYFPPYTNQFYSSDYNEYKAINSPQKNLFSRTKLEFSC